MHEASVSVRQGAPGAATNWRPRLALADAARDRADWAAAARLYRAHLKARPSDFRIWVQLGHALKESGQRAEALVAYSRALGLKRDDPDLLLNMGHLHKLMGHGEAAADYYERSASIDGNSAAVDELSAIGRAVAADRTGAGAALEGGPADRTTTRRLRGLDLMLARLPSRATLQEANSARDRRDWPAAASSYGAYLRGQPRDFGVWVQYGHALKEAGRTSDALAAYRTAFALEPRDSDLLLNLGHLFKVMGRLQEALEYYRRSAAIDNNRHALSELGVSTVKAEIPLMNAEATGPSDSAVARRAALDSFPVKGGRRDLADALRTAPPQDAPWFYFDPAHYLLQCDAGGLAIDDRSTAGLLRHYLDHAGRLKFDPNPLFDEALYQARYPAATHMAARPAWVNGFEHFANIGAFGGYAPSWCFEPAYYAAACAAACVELHGSDAASDVFAHYLSVGLPKGLGGMFLTGAALKLSLRPAPTSTSDLITILGDSAVISKWLGGLFDPDWYAAKYGVGGSVGDLLAHYLTHSGAQGLSPSATFSEDRYLALYPDVRAAVLGGDFQNGYHHFLAHGMHEARRPFDAFDPDFYLSANAGAYDECVRYRLTAYLHFLKFRGARELIFQPPFGVRPVSEAAGKGLYERRAHVVAATARIRIPAFETVEASIIIVAKNKFAETFNCIESIVSATSSPFEIIVYDNGSVDDIARIERIVEGVRVVRSPVNKGFTIPVNEAARIARGSHIILVNNDTEICPGAVDRSLEILAADPTIGIVGGRIIRTHGQLQEAGSIVWHDGSCLGYGRDLSPFDGRIDFQRDVDYCSGCYLAFSAALWKRLGGFDEAFAPAYYEETDLCLRVWESGLRVVYDPLITLWHFEFGTSTLPDQAIALMRRNQAHFVAKHQAYLADCQRAAPENIERARLRHVQGKRVLFIEDQIPDPRTGMGFVRSAQLAKTLEAFAGHLTVVGMHPGVVERPPWDRASWGARTEVLRDVDHRNLPDFLAARSGLYDVLWLSRTHNLRHLQAWRHASPELFDGLCIIVDTEAVASVRAALKAQIEGRREALPTLVAVELAGLEFADEICVVNDIDKHLVEDYLANRGATRMVNVVGHALTPVVSPPDYSETRGIVLTGSFANPTGPNIDAVRWFDQAVRPRLAEDIQGEPFVIAGAKARDFVETAGLDGHYDVLTDLEDMVEVYRRARVVVAPTRYAAGIPYKVHEAAAHGVPVVMSELLGKQLGWTDAPALGVIIGSAPEAFADRISQLYRDASAWSACRAEQTRRIERDCSPAKYDQTIRQILTRV